MADNNWSILFSKENRAKTGALAGGLGIHAINIYLVTTILPSVVEDIGGMEFYSWNSTLFVLTSILGSFLSVRLLNTYGPRRSFQLSIAIFIAGTLACTLAPTMYVMLIGRTVQGFGGGLLMALSYSMVRVVYSEALWPRAMALLSGIWGVAALSGPFIGGIFAELDIWRMAFGAIVIFSIILLFLISKVFPRRHQLSKQNTAIPFGKLILLSIAILCLSFGSLTSNLTFNLTGLLISFIFIFIIVRLEKNSTSRLLPRGAYTFRSTLGVVYAAMALLILCTNPEIYIPYFFQEIHQYAPLKAGYLTVIISLGWTAASIRFSGVAKSQVYNIIRLGPLCMFVGILMLAFLLPSPFGRSSLGFILTCMGLALTGIGIGLGWPHLLTLVLSSAKKGDEDQASTSITSIQLIATAFGTAFAGIITNLAGINEPGGLEGAQSAAFWLFILFAIFPLLCLFIVSSYLKKPDRV
ncbi:MFS transporter [Albibacterium indicum]|uniref:MFS transporter n=1 Tax=Albibacterium indicum TaxID=2292082 RepID=UPI000E4D6D90|nr:MFS transporter [Pedobacter indicus]